MVRFGDVQQPGRYRLYAVYRGYIESKLRCSPPSLLPFYQLVLYPLESGVRDVLYGLVKQVGQYWHDRKTSCRRPPCLEFGVLRVHKGFLGLFDRCVYRERREGPDGTG
jgi:hypothetical protein